MKNRTSLRFGILGTAVASLVCLSPVVITLLGVFGLSSWFGWIDSVFHVVFLLSIGLIILGLYRLWQNKKVGVPETIGSEP